MRKQAGLMAVLVVLLGGLAGCASNLSGDSYSRSEARQPAIVTYGTVVSLRPVQVEGTKSGIGTGAGAIAGGIGASGLGGGNGSGVYAVIGAVAGGLLGSAAEEGMTRTQAVEIVVRDNQGVDRAYVQKLAENERFNVGDKVRVMTTGSNSRVAHMQ